MNNIDILDAHGASPLTAWHPHSATYGSGVIGTIAERVNALGHVLKMPAMSGLNDCVRVGVVPLQPGTYLQKETKKKEMLYRALRLVTGIANLIPGLPLALIGISLQALCFPLKKDFVFSVPAQHLPLQTQDKVSLLTSNMALLPEFISTRNRLSSVHKRAEQLPGVLLNACQAVQSEEPDVILGQEAFQPEATSKVINQLQQRGYAYSISDVAPSLLGLNSGLMIASKHPLHNPVFYHHAYTKGWIEKRANKGVLIVTALIGNKKIVIANTHLSGTAPGGGVYPRVIQVQETMKYIDEYVQDLLNKGETIDGVFVSCDANISPISVSPEKGQPSQPTVNMEWFLSTLLQHRNEQELSAWLDEINLFSHEEHQKIIDLLQVIRTSQSRKSSTWEGYSKALKPLIAFLESKEIPLQEMTSNLFRKGGPFPSDKYRHDLICQQDALLGNAIWMELHNVKGQSIDDSMITTRLDFHLVRTKKGFTETAGILKEPERIRTDILALSAPFVSDHKPVLSQYYLSS